MENTQHTFGSSFAGSSSSQELRDAVLQSLIVEKKGVEYDHTFIRDVMFSSASEAVDTQFHILILKSEHCFKFIKSAKFTDGPGRVSERLRQTRCWGQTQEVDF
jgi:hypothetical protein